MTDQGDEGADLTELFAYFGRAVYMANVLETALAQTLLQVEYMTRVRAEYVRTKGKDFDRKKHEDEFDTYFEEQLSKTMGQLGKLVKAFPDLSDELKGRIEEAIKRRNFLIHDYWREAGYMFETEDGRAKMIAELSNDIDTFEKLAQDIMEATKPVRARLGISEETLNERVEDRMADLMDGLVLD
jgi:hypothetical protein